MRLTAAAAIAVLAVSSLGTQLAGMAMQRNVAFGIIPAFDAAGARNLPVAVDTIGLALTAAWIGIAAAAMETRGLAGAFAWRLLAVLAASLSFQRLVLPPSRSGQLPAWLVAGGGPWTPPSPVDAAWLASLPVVAFVVWRAVRTTACAPARRRLVGGAALLAAAAALGWIARWAKTPGSQQLQLAVAVPATFGQAAELIGLTAILGAVARHIRELTPELRLSADASLPRTMTTRATGGSVEIAVSPRRLGRIVFAVIAVLLAAHATAIWARAGDWPSAVPLHRAFYVDAEGNVPTWWSTMQLLACGVVAAALAASHYAGRDPLWRYWALLSVVFVLMSTDEAASLHELLQAPLRALLQSRTFHFPLIIPGSIAAVALALGFRRFVRTLGPTRAWLLAGASLFGFGSLGVETVSGWYAPDLVGENPLYTALTTIEEAAEMLGAAILLVGLLGHAAREGGPLRLALQARPGKAA